MRVLVPLLVAVGAACASAPPAAESSAASGTGASASLDRDPETGGLLRPDQIFRILEGSRIRYTVESTRPVAPAAVAEMVDQPVQRTRPVDVYVALEDDDSEGPRRVHSHRPPAEIAELFGVGGEAFSRGAYEAAARFYSKAVEARPDYFKSYTYLGRSLFYMDEYRGAERALARALELNPVDYQALLFLGDTYYQLGQFERAKTLLTRAYMLNRNSDTVQDRLQATLAKLKLQIRDGRLAPRVRVERTEERTVEMRFHPDGALRWRALAACMACWAYEDQCQARASRDEDPLRLSMYRECLINQAVSIAMRREQAEDVAPEESALLSAIEDGYLEAIIFWEVVAEVAPMVIFLLPEAVQEDILRYIEQYVFVSTRVV